MANMTFKASLLPSADNTYSLGSNDTNNLKRWKINGFSGGPIEYIVGEQAVATGSWTGTTQDSELITGKAIAYKLPFAGSGNASLTLTFTNPTGASNSGAIPVYLNNTRVTTHYAAGSVIIMVYDGTNWRSTDYWNSNSRDAGYGKINLTQSDATTAITTNTTQLAAYTYNEAITLTAGNKWVQFQGTNSSSNNADILTVGHSLSGVTAGDYGDDSDQTPNYGDTFNVPTLSVDAAGHITAISTHSVKIPTSDDTDVKQRIYGSATNVELPIPGINGSASTTATVPLIGTSYKDTYAAIPTANIATINPSTGKITIPGGLKVGVGNSTRMPTTGIEVHNTSTEEFTPETIGHSINFFVTDKTNPVDNTWCSGIYIRGGESAAYGAWCLTGPAGNANVSTKPLYVRTSKSATEWGDYRKIYDTSNKPTPEEILGESDTTKFWRGDNSWSNELTDNLKVKTLTITDTDVHEHLKFSCSNNYNYITIPNNTAASLAFGYSTGTANTLVRLTSTTWQPERTNEISLGVSGTRWSKLYVGTADSYGSNTQPIYWNAGVPTAITYTANRLYYPSAVNSFTAGTHFVSDTKIAINSTNIPNETLYVNGTSYHNGNDTHAGSIYPQTDSQYDIGGANQHWRNGVYDNLFVSTNTGYVAASSTVAGTRIGTGQIDLTNTTPIINFHRSNAAAVSGAITGDSQYGIMLSGIASATGASVRITGSVGSTGITYNGRTIKPVLQIDGITYANSAIETPLYFMCNTTGTSSNNNGFYLLRDAAQYGRLYIEQKGTATEGDGEGTPYTNTVGETVLELGNAKQGTPGNADSIVDNARGRLLIFGQGTKYNEIRSSLTDTSGSYVHDLPAASGYLQTNNSTVAITKTDGEWTAANWNRQSGYYLPLVTATGQAFLSDVFQPSVRLYAAAASNGYSRLALGNNIPQGTAKNCYGVLILFGTGGKYSALYTAQVTDNNKVYLPAYDGTAYLAHTANNDAVGDEATPVYVAANGRLTSTGINLNNTYVKKAGDIMTGPLDAQNHIVVSTKTAGNSYAQSGSAIQIREVNRVGNTQSDWTYAPKIGFHWANQCALQLGMDSSQYLRLYSNDSQNYGRLRVGELYCQNANGLRFCNSTPGRNFLFRNDGLNFYGLICTGSDSADDWVAPSTGTYPLRIDLENGNSYFSRAYGAVWNDYAEYRKDNEKEKDMQQPGRCIKENGDGTLSLTTKRLERGCEIISDTFGFSIGQDEENGYNTPIASSGRVLAYPYESIEEFASHIGYAVCSGPNGTVSIMTDEEEEKYPMRAIGTISEIPDYEEWGSGKVKVNGRIWIRIR